MGKDRSLLMSIRTGTALTSQIAHDILSYLIENPTAQDTLEGIVEWWLLQQEVQRQTAAVKEALASLVAHGLLLERKGKDGRVYYRLNPHALSKIPEVP